MTRTSKEQARKLVYGRLSELSHREYEENSRAAYEHVKALLGKLQKERAVRDILSYRAMRKWHEVDVSELSNEFSGIDFEYTQSNRSAAFPDSLYDVILVPLYGFTREGYRLGHGGGWYDKLLADQPQAIKIGVGLEAGLIDFTADTYDIPMAGIITEKRRGLL